MFYPVLVPVAISEGILAIRYLSRLLSSAVHIWDKYERPSIFYLRDRICSLVKDRFGFKYLDCKDRIGLEILCMVDPYQYYLCTFTWVPVLQYTGTNNIQ